MHINLNFRTRSVITQPLYKKSNLIDLPRPRINVMLIFPGGAEYFDKIPSDISSKFEAFVSKTKCKQYLSSLYNEE